MEHLQDPVAYVGLRGMVVPKDNDDFSQEFEGFCIGVRNGFLKVRDQLDEVFEVEVSQFTPETTPLCLTPILVAPYCSDADWKDGIHKETNGTISYYTKTRRFCLRMAEDAYGAVPCWLLESMRPRPEVKKV